jgi:dTDP-4-dehydrorhamnose reductase
MKRVLIIGSSGMLGIDLADELKKDYDVSGVDVMRPASAINTERSGASAGRHASCVMRNFYKGDITKRIEITRIIRNAKPDAVILTAAMTDVDGCELDPAKAYKINGEGAKNVALACKQVGAPLIYISTDFVFDGKKKKPYKETDKPKPVSVYGDSKLKGERAIKRTLKNYFILRTSWLYGKRGKNFVDTILAKARTGESLKVVDDQVGSPTSTIDLARAIHILLSVIASPAKGVAKQSQNVSYGIYHISNSGSVSWYDYAKEILRLTGSKAKVEPISSTELKRPAKRPAMSVLDNSKFEELTGYKMRNWQEALASYV